jgi:hypothetical protein
LLGAYSKAKDDAMITAFGGRGKKRLNRVFDVIGFVYPDYFYPSRKQGKKIKIVVSAISSTPKPKKVKALTHHPRRAEMAEVPRPIEGSSSISEPSRSTPVEARTELAEDPELKTAAERPKALSLLRETELPKASKIPAVTPRRRRMASVLDAVMESIKVQTPGSARDTVGEALKESDEAGTSEAKPSSPTEARPLGAAPLIEEKENAPEKLKSPAPEAPAEEHLLWLL